MEKHILIIEDNHQNLYLMRFLLEKNGYTVSTAENGPDGIAAARDLHPEAVLLDIQLPGMDGYEILEHLQKDPALCLIPVVAVTSYAMAGDRERILQGGAHGYIEKPINPDSFIAQIEEVINRHAISQKEKTSDPLPLKQRKDTDTQ